VGVLAPRILIGLPQNHHRDRLAVQPPHDIDLAALDAEDERIRWIGVRLPLADATRQEPA
jgi:hypothetical protein